MARTYPATPTSQPAWDPSGNGAAFDRHRAHQDPDGLAVGRRGLRAVRRRRDHGRPRSGRHLPDQRRGPASARTSSSPPATAPTSHLPAGCGGVAYLGVFDTVNGTAAGPPATATATCSRPGSSRTSSANSPKNIAEAVSHEVGHNLGLDHDGNASTGLGYDPGHGAWAPIMGVGYDHPITQWSKGDYTGANNHRGRRRDHPSRDRVAGRRGREQRRRRADRPRAARPTSRAAPTSTPTCSAPAPAP